MIVLTDGVDNVISIQDSKLLTWKNNKNRGSSLTMAFVSKKEVLKSTWVRISNPCKKADMSSSCSWLPHK